MANISAALDSMMEEKLLSLHTAFVAKVIAANADGSVCSVQPLNRIKAYGETAKNQAVITNVPVVKSARVKEHTLSIDFENQSFEYEDEFLAAGDVVLCVCGERSISGSLKGGFSTPPTGRHQLNDAVVVGIL